MHSRGGYPSVEYGTGIIFSPNSRKSAYPSKARYHREWIFLPPAFSFFNQNRQIDQTDSAD
jgi:hypothetical protein